ncbi:MAG: gliding motility-associated ABC transporter substrate-binding protein GldG [Bacteroidetes bacterium]|nr:gliding motility-associated ABC transporter substrate-binding protein GldG [Bacteroidota bacterium]MDA0898925.1 gliding motility-associated ABC transporter substrate-binding protein GldG [Bacteroidota bacterium]
MIAQLRKELKVYFSGILGYLIIGIYLLINGLMLWVFNGPFNLLEGGYAALENYFGLAPWVFLFLVPAIGMRIFSDELKSGMMELLVVRPISVVQLVWAKFLGALAVVLLAVLPTLVYLWSINALGSPVGNLDWGAAVGSFIGLIALGAAYTAVAVFASALTTNNVVAFVLGVAFNMGLYLGFEALADLYKFSGWELTVRNLGINEHYRSMSRGVIDARDLGYFVSLVLLFIGATVAVIGRPHLKSPWGKAGIYMGAAILLLLLSFSARFRFDLTEEQRFSLSEGTESLLSQIEEPLLIKVYLSGDFPAGFERLQRETQHQLEEWSAKNGNVFFEFINPNTVDNSNEFKNQLGTKGINAVQLQVQNKDGQSVLNVFPGAILSYQEREATAVLLEDVMVYDPAEQVNISIQQLEFNLAKALNTLLTTDKPKVAMITGHGELSAVETAGIGLALSENYTVDRFSMTAYKALPNGDPDLQDMIRRLNTYKCAIVAKPTEAFSELDKYLLDQYAMGGGKLMWFIDGVHAEMDSLSFGPEFLAYPAIYDLNIVDLLFKYGVRINADVIQDVRCGGVNDRRSIQPWVYFPLLAAQNHPAVQNLNAVKGEFASTLDTLESPGIRSSILLRTSINSKAIAAPHTVSLEALYNRPDPREFTQRDLVTGVLLEGKFTSAYAQRIVPKAAGEGLPQLKESPMSAMAVFSDGDFIRNQVNLINPELPRGQPLSLGYDQYTGVQYGNDDLVLNVVDYMLDDKGLMQTRTRDFKLRLLDGEKLVAEANKWKLINVAIPEALLLLAALLFNLLRLRKYAHS